MQKIVICGMIGAGKTTLAHQLSVISGIEVSHIDRLFFHGNWIYKMADDRDALLDEVTQRPSWIIEGVIPEAPKYIIEGKLPDIDHLVFLNVSLWIRLKRFLRRTYFYYGKIRPDVPDGAIDLFTLKGIKRVIDNKRWFMSRFSPEVKKLPDGVNFIILRSEKDVQRFLEYAKARMENI